MSFGLQIFDASGNNILDTNDGIATLIGLATYSISLSAHSGSFSVADLARGSPFFFLVDTPKGPTFGESLEVTISFSGTTINWSVAASIYDGDYVGTLSFWYGYF